MTSLNRCDVDFSWASMGKFLSNPRESTGSSYDQDIECALGFPAITNFNLDEHETENILKGAEATFYRAQTKLCDCIVYFAAIPGAVRIVDAVSCIFHNVVVFWFEDVSSGLSALLDGRVSYLINIPIRFILLIRNLFHLIAGIAHMVPLLGSSFANVVYLINIGIERIIDRVSSLFCTRCLFVYDHLAEEGKANLEKLEGGYLIPIDCAGFTKAQRSILRQ